MNLDASPFGPDLEDYRGNLGASPPGQDSGNHQERLDVSLFGLGLADHQGNLGVSPAEPEGC